MFGRIVLGVILWSASTCIGHSQQSSAQQNSVSTTASFDVSYPNFTYQITVPSLRQLNFKNLKVFWSPGDKLERGVELHNGTFERSHVDDFERVELDSVDFLDSPDKKSTSAVISLDWIDCGGSCTHVGIAQVFEIRRGRPTVTQRIEYDRSALGTGQSFNEMTRILHIIGRTDDHSPNCCPENLDVMRFDWDGGKFVFKAARTVPSLESQMKAIDRWEESEHPPQRH